MNRHRFTKPPPGRTLNSAHPYGHGTKLLLPMNELDGVLLNDLSPVRNNATMVGGAGWSGGAVNLDGTDGEIVMRRVAGLTDWTVWLRCKPDDVTSIIRTLVDQGDILIKQTNDGVVFGATSNLEIDYTSTVATVLTAGEFADIFVTRAGTAMTCYVFDADGVLTTGSFTVSGTAKTSLTNLILGSQSRTAFVYPASAMTNLTSEQIAIINAADVLEIPTGSKSLDSDIISENWNGMQISLEFIIRPDFVPGDGVLHYLFDNQGTGASEDRTRCYIDTAGLLTFVVHDTDSTQHLVSHDVTDWTAGTEYYVVCVLDLNNDSMILYVSGVAEDSTPTAALSSDSIGAIATDTQIGQDSSNANQLNGGIKYRFWNRVLSATEITAQWNSGDMVEFSIVSDDVIAIDDFTQSATGIIFAHRGKSGTTDNSDFTTDIGVFGADNDAIRISEGTGYSVQGFIDGTPSGVNIPHDDGAGSPITDVEKVGVSMNCDGSHYAEGGNILDPAANDFCVSIWTNVDPAGTNRLVEKWDGTDGWFLGLTASRQLYLHIELADASVAILNTGTALSANRWHHIAVTWDRDGNAVGYIDGVLAGVTLDISAQDGDISNANNFLVGAKANHSRILEGSVKDVKFYSGGLWSAAQILYQATHPHDVGASAGTITEAYAFDENTGTTAAAQVTSPGNDLTLSSASGWDQQAYVSQILNIDPGMENGGIGGWTIVGTPTLVDKESDTDSDSQSLHIVSAADDDGVSQAISASNGEKFYLYQRHKVTAGSFEVNVTNGGGGIETGIADAAWTGLEKIISATGNLTFQWLGEAAADDFNISKAQIRKCVAGDSLVADKRYSRVYNTDTANVGIEWSGLGSDATEVQAGDLYIVDDTAAATVATRIRTFSAEDIDGLHILDRALSQNDIEAIQRQKFAMIR